MKGKEFVYICSPLSAPTEEGIRKNMKKAAHYCELAAKELGCRTIAPHSFLPEYLDDNIPQEREIALEFGLSILKIAKAVIVCGDVISSGMKGEIKKAGECGIPVYRLIEGEKGCLFVRTEGRRSVYEMQICKNSLSE